MLLKNDKGGSFNAMFTHGATSTGINSHGDMGAAFDYNLDGKVDILSGDDNPGRWRLFENQSETENHFIIIDVGYSDSGVDPIGAEVRISNGDLEQFHDVGSAGATHAQSILNQVHFGLGKSKQVSQIVVRWRDGSEQTLESVAANQMVSVGKSLSQ